MCSTDPIYGADEVSLSPWTWRWNADEVDSELRLWPLGLIGRVNQ